MELKFLSVNNIVIAPARTGMLSSNRDAVIKTDQTKSGRLPKRIPSDLMFNIVTRKLIAPNILLIPAICNENMAKSTDTPELAMADDRGGYRVQPVPTPSFMTEDSIKKVRDGGRSQKLILFILGNAISGAPTIIGINQLP